MKSNIYKNQRIIFPENAGFTISKIMKEHNLGETPKEIFEKIKKKEKTKVGEIAKIIKETAEGKMTVKKFPSEIQRRLNITFNKAEELAQEFQKKILIFVKKIPIEEEEEKLSKTIKSPLKTPEVPVPKAPKIKEKSGKRDVYRESVE